MRDIGVSVEDTRLLARALDHEMAASQGAAAVAEARGDTAAARDHRTEAMTLEVLRARLAHAWEAQPPQDRRRQTEIRRRQAERLPR